MNDLKITKWERDIDKINIELVDQYCNKYKQVREKTLKLIDELEKAGLEVINFEIKRTKGINNGI